MKMMFVSFRNEILDQNMIFSYINVSQDNGHTMSNSSSAHTELDENMCEMWRSDSITI